MTHNIEDHPQSHDVARRVSPEEYSTLVELWSERFRDARLIAPETQVFTDRFDDVAVGIGAFYDGRLAGCARLVPLDPATCFPNLPAFEAAGLTAQNGDVEVGRLCRASWAAGLQVLRPLVAASLVGAFRLEALRIVALVEWPLVQRLERWGIPVAVDPTTASHPVATYGREDLLVYIEPADLVMQARECSGPMGRALGAALTDGRVPIVRWQSSTNPVQ